MFSVMIRSMAVNENSAQHGARNSLPTDAKQQILMTIVDATVDAMRS